MSGSPKRLLHCIAEKQSTFAIADTGSDVDIVPLDLAKRRSAVVEQLDASECFIRIADGGIISLHSKVMISIVLRDGSPSSMQTFYVWEGLTSDMLSGDKFLFETDSFKTYQASFAVHDTGDTFSGVNTIVWLKNGNVIYQGLESLDLMKPRKRQVQFERTGFSTLTNGAFSMTRVDTKIST